MQLSNQVNVQLLDPYLKTGSGLDAVITLRAVAAVAPSLDLPRRWPIKGEPPPS